MHHGLSKSTVLPCVAVFLAIALSMGQPALAAPAVILSTSGNTRQDTGTIWRYFETWQEDVARVGDKLVDVNIFDNRQKANGGKGEWVLKEPKHPLGSPLPADGWQKSDFDDSDWIRNAGPFTNMWRGLSLICMRGKFQVSDPSQVTEMSLTVKFQGGVVAYINGTEVGRSGMPEGKIDDATLATDYPQSAYVNAKGVPIPQVSNGRRILGATDDIKQVPYELKDEDTLNRFKSRGRVMEIKIPAAQLKKGVNVLSIAIHHSAADPIMYLTQDTTSGHRENLSRCWNRASCESIALSATSAAGAIVPNVSRPEGLQVWTEESMVQINASRYGDPSESLKPIQLCGMKNGTYAGQVLVGARGSIKDVKATVGNLTFGQATIPASAMQIYYRNMASDALEVSPVATAGSIMPIWLSVKVPKDAPAGKYAGTLSVQANGEKPVAVPVEMKVVGDWAVPDARNFTAFVGVMESADSVAMQYKEPLWSESHWKHIDAVYQLLSEIGVKDLYLPLIAKTHLANEQSMVRWIKQPDGTYTYDFTVLEKYLDIALKHLGKPQVVGLYLHDYGFRIEQNANRGANSDTAGGLSAIKPTVTAVDPATGKLSEFQPPDWGTPEALKFWKPVIDQTLELLAKRGLEKSSVMFGIGANNWVRAETLADLNKLYPDIPWVNRTHFFTPNVADGKEKQVAGLASVVAGAVAVSYDPDEAGLKVGWKSKGLVIDFPRLDNVEGAVFNEYLPTYRFFAEGVMLSGGMRWNSLPPSRGVGHIGADYWPVIKAGNEMHNLADRYVFWHSLSLADVVSSILAPGVDGPARTVRHSLMREALQESEARVLVQNALLDPTQTARIGPELAKRCAEVCAERTNVLRYYSKFAQPAMNNDYARVFSERQWETMSEKLYQAASDVAKALAKN